MHVEWEPEVAVEADHFRHVLGHFPTGVAVLTAGRAEGQVGMACNSLTSVSLDPPLISICPARTSETWPEIRAAGQFLINLMRHGQDETVAKFARKGIDRFAAVPFHERRCGPALDDAMAWIECVIEAEHDAGDHTLVIARVLRLELGDVGDPLVFFRGRYGTFAGHLG
jgi:3-hydroxy-9,10-secoandrosta-1,3,5(10)-triene-9,17-dione monooxygenase reductase component